MSGKAVGRVWELRLPAAHRMVLLALADHADHLGANIYPSIGLIAWKTGYSESQVRRIMQRLVTDGLLIAVRIGGGRGNTNGYRFDLNAGMVKAPFGPGSGGNGIKTTPIVEEPGTMTPYPTEKASTATPIIGNGRMMTPYPTEKLVTMTPFTDNPAILTPIPDNPSTMTPIQGTERVSFPDRKGVISELKGVIAMTPEGTEGSLRNDDERPPPSLFKIRNDDEDRGTNDGDSDEGPDDGFDPYESLIEIEFAPVQATDALTTYRAAGVTLDRAEVARIADFIAENPAGKRTPHGFLAAHWKRGKVFSFLRKAAARPGPAWDTDTQRFEPQPATISSDVIEAARRLRADLDARAPEPDQYVSKGAMAAALAGMPLKPFARQLLHFPGR